MTQVITVYPVKGRLILMPERGFQPVPDEGASVTRDAYYTRALLQGDLTLDAPDTPAAATETADAVLGDAPAPSPAPDAPKPNKK